MAAEITYKLRANANNGIPIKLSEFLKLPEVREAGITLEEARKGSCQLLFTWTLMLTPNHLQLV